MIIGLLITGHVPMALRSAHGDYDRIFQRFLEDQGFEFRTFMVVDGHFPRGADVADGWLITGSRHGVYEDHDWIPPLESLIREIEASGRPLVGICFGHQIIAQALGGRAEKFAGGWAVGRTTYETEDGPLTLHAWHQDQVVEPPAGARVLGAVVQRRRSPDPATYIGSGKVEEVRRVAEQRDASLVLFDEDLTPAQGTELEDRLGVRVMDRTELILDIFALRARTSEAKTQVELAQLQQKFSENVLDATAAYERLVEDEELRPGRLLRGWALAGILCYATSPFILNRYARDLRAAGIQPHQV